ncbi:MAG: LptF/LptG family permease [Leptospiraceae bacterium]|nr:LptF/LptG family permease [Leptospiraceae bacterium]
MPKKKSGEKQIPPKEKKIRAKKKSSSAIQSEKEPRPIHGNSSADLRTIRIKSDADMPKGFVVHTDKKRFIPFFRVPILNKYILKEIISPFLVALSFFTMIYMAMALQKMVGLFVGKGVDALRLLDYFGYLLGNTLPSTIPMACLMSGIMASGRLSGDSEITAMRSAGISFTRIYSNFLIFGFVTAIIVGYLNFYLAPENTRKLNEFNNWILAYNPMIAVTPGQFSGDQTQEAFAKKGRTLYTEGMNRDTGELQGVQIREWEIYMEGNEYIRHNNIVIPMGGSRVTQIISAKQGTIVEKRNSKGEFEKSIRLRNGFVIEWNEKKDGFTITNFLNGEMDYNVPTQKQKSLIGFNIKPETFSFPMLFSIRNSIETEGMENVPGLEMVKEMGLSIKGIGGLTSMINQMKMDIVEGAQKGTLSSDDLSNRYATLTQLMNLLKDSKKTVTAFNVEIHRRIATPISCQIFFFLSFPLGLVVKRSGKGMSFTLASVFLFIYYLFFIMGSSISYKSKIPDWIGPWSANIVIASISVYIMTTRTDIQLPFEKWLRPLKPYWNKISPYLDKIKVVKKPFAILWQKVSPTAIRVTEKIRSSKIFLKLTQKFQRK